MGHTHRIWRRTALALLVVGLVAAVAFSQGWLMPGSVLAQTATPTATAPAGDLARTITVVGEGSVKIAPDIATATIGVETVASTVKAASADSQKVMDKVLAALKAAGIADKDMQTTNYNVWMEQSTSSDGTDTVKYHVSNSVMVTIRDLDQVGNVLDAAIEAGANQIYGVTFSLENPKTMAETARTQAVADAKAKAGSLADLTGVKLGPVVSVSEVVGQSGTYYNSDFAAKAEGLGGGGTSVSPGELELSMSLQVTYAIQ
jgi:uncharacterized protein YggE